MEQRSGYGTLRARTWEVLIGQDDSALGRAVPFAIGVLILLNVAIVIAESFPDWSDDTLRRLHRFDFVSVGVFAIEYVLRVWSCVEDPRYRAPVLGRLRFAVTPLALVDFLAIVPAFIPAAKVDLRTARLLRLIRILRVLKLGRYSRSLQLFGKVFSRARTEIVSCMIVLCMLMVVGSSLMYFAERDAQPDAFPTIVATMWWGMATLSTVGYGDVYPITGLGKLIGSVVAVLGIGFFALPAGILTTNYLSAVREMKNEGQRCPHCGQPAPEQDPDDTLPDAS
jgi:voltage-gated potassium channel